MTPGEKPKSSATHHPAPIEYFPMFRFALFVVLPVALTYGEPITVITWNVESGGAQPATIARELAGLPTVDAFLLQEVSPKDIGRFAAAIRDAHGKSYKFYMSSLGGSDRLAIIFDESRYALRSFQEHFSFGQYRLNDWNHRSPLVAHLKRKSDGGEFLLVTVHLARGNEQLRTEQATGLREWAKAQALPVLLAGDCNFDFDFNRARGNAAYDAFFADNVWILAKPREWTDTNWSDRDGDGKDNYPDSALDFGAFYPAKASVSATCDVIVRPGDFPDTKFTSDHRPVLVTFDVSPAGP